VLWLGGMSGVGKTTAARAIARRYDVRLYSLDSRTYEHAAALPVETRTPDEIWVDSTAEALADWFEDMARARFPLVVADLLEIEDAAPIIVDGPQVLPELVAPLLRSPAQALYVFARAELHRQLVTERGSLTDSQTRDPDRARENRLRRDEVLVERLRAEAPNHDLPIAQVADVTETKPLVEQHFAPFLSAWAAVGDHGDFVARRRDENDARLRQWRLYANDVPDAAEGEIDLACECQIEGCTKLVRIPLADAEAVRAAALRLLSPGHS